MTFGHCCCAPHSRFTYTSPLLLSIGDAKAHVKARGDISTIALRYSFPTILECQPILVEKKRTRIPFASDEARLECLFKLYEKMTMNKK